MRVAMWRQGEPRQRSVSTVLGADSLGKDAAMADEELIGVTLAWRGTTKRLFLAGPGGAKGKALMRQALVALDQQGDEATNWSDFLATAVRVFKDHGFIWADT